MTKIKNISQLIRKSIADKKGYTYEQYETHFRIIANKYNFLHILRKDKTFIVKIDLYHKNVCFYDIRDYTERRLVMKSLSYLNMKNIKIEKYSESYYVLFKYLGRKRIEYIYPHGDKPDFILHNVKYLKQYNKGFVAIKTTSHKDFLIFKINAYAIGSDINNDKLLLKEITSAVPKTWTKYSLVFFPTLYIRALLTNIGYARTLKEVESLITAYQI